MTVVKRVVDVVAASSPRVSLVLKADIRAGHTGQLTAKVRRVEERLAAGGQPKGSPVGRRQQPATASEPSVRRRSSERS